MTSEVSSSDDSSCIFTGSFFFCFLRLGSRELSSLMTLFFFGGGGGVVFGKLLALDASEGLIGVDCFVRAIKEFSLAKKIRGCSRKNW